MQRKYSLDALAVRDAAHGESFIDSATLPADHYADKDLDSFLVSFHDASVHAHAIANRKRFDITFLLFLLNRIDDLIHKLLASARGCGRTLSFEGSGFATRNRQAFEHEHKAPALSRHHQKICENLWDLWLIPRLIALVAQLDRALASEAKGCGFDPRRAHRL
jgi:hypothetical protein